MHKEPFGKEYLSYEAYINSPDLDFDLIGLHLWKGDRIPQNENEIRMKKELDEIRAKGQTPYYDFFD